MEEKGFKPKLPPSSLPMLSRTAVLRVQMKRPPCAPLALIKRCFPSSFNGKVLEYPSDNPVQYYPNLNGVSHVERIIYWSDA